MVREPRSFNRGDKSARLKDVTENVYTSQLLSLKVKTLLNLFFTAHLDEEVSPTSHWAPAGCSHTAPVSSILMWESEEGEAEQWEPPPSLQVCSSSSSSSWSWEWSWGWGGLRPGCSDQGRPAGAVRVSSLCLTTGCELEMWAFPQGTAEQCVRACCSAQYSHCHPGLFIPTFPPALLLLLFTNWRNDKHLGNPPS